MELRQALLRKIVKGLLRGRISRDPIQATQRILADGNFIFSNGMAFNVWSDWEGITKFGRSDQRSLHMHGFIGDFITAAAQTKNNDLLICASEIVFHWRAQFSYPRDANSMAYHDETVAQRIGYWLKLLLSCEESGQGAVAKKLKALLLDEIAILASDKFHAGLNNHGMFQDFALLYCFVLNLADERILNNSLDRLEKYFQYSIAEDGVHKEHSPQYHYNIAQSISAHLPLLRVLNSDCADRIQNLLHKMGNYAVNIVTPNGRFPPIGDTPPKPIPADYYEVFGCNDSKLLLSPSAIFPHGGYGIIRDDLSKGEKQTFIVFCASHHGDYHKHRDDLSLLVYCGGWVIGESGPFSYDYSNPLSQHGYSSAAHSTLMVDGNNPGRGGKPELVKIVRHSDDGVVCNISGINRRHDGVEHTRDITFSRKAMLLTVTDTVISEASHDFALLWQISSDIELLQNGYEFKLMRNDKKLFKLSMQSDSQSECDVLYGDNDPVTKGFVFPQTGKSVPTSVIRLRTSLKKQWRVVTTLFLPCI